jgi:hypothetical protein
MTSRSRSVAATLAMLATLSSLAFGHPLGAQSNHFAPLVLQLPSSARALALGDAWFAGRDADAMFYNPAQLATARGTELSVERYASASTSGAMSSAMSFGSGGIGIGAQYLDYGALETVYPSTQERLTMRGPLVASSLAATVGAATVFKGVRFGASGKYVEERRGGARGGRLAADLGASFDLRELLVGVAVQNLGPDMHTGDEHAALPQRYALGISTNTFPAGPFDIDAVSSVAVLRNGFVTPAGGVEAIYSWIEGYAVVARFGVRRTETSAQSAATLGAGLTADRVSLDYAYEGFSGTRGAHRIGLRIR